MAGQQTDGPGPAVGLEPLDAEVDAELAVEGRLPDWLRGTLLRNGPGRWTARADGGQRMRHWFDGLAMLHRFAFGNGRVRYRNRYLRSRAYQHAATHGELGYTEFGTVPPFSLRDRFAALRRPPVFGDNASVNVLTVAGRPVAVTESPEPVGFDPVTLDTLGPVRFTDAIPGVVTTAHPHHDATRAVQVNYTVEFGRRNAYHLYELADDSTTRRPLATVPVDRPSYMHSFAMTEHFVVLMEYPYRAHPLSLLAGRSPFDAYRWEPEHGTQFTVVDRADGRVVQRSRTGALFCWHQVNAFEVGDDLVLDLPVMPGRTAMSQFLLSELRGPGPRTPAGELRRYRVPLGGGPVTYRLLTTTPIEFPRIAYERVSTRPYRFVYGVSTPDSLAVGFSDRLVKIDVATGEARVWARPGCLPGEPVHVAPPRPGAGPGTVADSDPAGTDGAEDDGVVLSFVLDTVAGRSFLLVLDAASFTETARVQLSHAVPLGFHGQYFPDLT